MRNLGRCGIVMTLAGLLLAAVLRGEGQAPACPNAAVNEQQKHILLDYVSKKYKLPESVTLSLTKDAFVNGTCYREVTFQGKCELSNWSLTLYASPDLRFLSTELLDTQRDPIEEERSKSQAVMSGLTAGPAPTRGPAEARVTIVEFSDFQCPFCRKFAQTVDEVLATGTADVRIVFHHLPLSGHAWARRAAEGAACAQLQSSEAFWALHNRLFQNQESITLDNIRTKLDEFARDLKEVDGERFHECVANSMSLGLVLKDLNLAEVNQVNGTPTLFINGHRVQGVENASRLRTLIAEARKEAGLVPSAAQKEQGPELCSPVPASSITPAKGERN